MRIGFDISQTGKNKAGCGYFAQSLIETLLMRDDEHTFILYPHFGTTYWDPDARNTTFRPSSSKSSRKMVGSNYADSMNFWKNIPPDGEDKLGNPDIVHSNNFSCPTSLRKAKLVYTLHDLSFLEHPEYTTELNRWICFNGVFEASVYADFIVAVSDYSRKKFLEIFPHYPESRIRTIHLGSRFSLIRENRDNAESSAWEGFSKGAFWLSVGTLEPRKNIRCLLEAYAEFSKSGQCSYPLVLAGGEGWLEEGLFDFIEALGIRSKIRLTGYTTDAQLAWLYRNCYAFIYPSFYEGFGLPVLEAMSMGAAVVTSDTTSLPEVAGDAAIYIDPHSKQDIIDAMRLLAVSPDRRDRLKTLALSQSKGFSWEKCAAEVLEVYKTVLSMDKYRQTIDGNFQGRD